MCRAIQNIAITASTRKSPSKNTNLFSNTPWMLNTVTEAENLRGNAPLSVWFFLLRTLQYWDLQLDSSCIINWWYVLRWSFKWRPEGNVHLLKNLVLEVRNTVGLSSLLLCEVPHQIYYKYHLRKSVCEPTNLKYDSNFRLELSYK